MISFRRRPRLAALVALAIGDLAARGMTSLDGRREAVAFPHPTFPTQIWLIATARSRIRSIEPSGKLVYKNDPRVFTHDPRFFERK